jgi:cytochrome c peroxidase
VKATQYITALIITGLFGAAVVVAYKSFADTEITFNADERDTIRSMSLQSLAVLPNDPSNRVANDPRAAALGRKLFFDKRLSSNGNVACATCHDPNRAFTNAQPLAVGVKTGPRHSMGLIGVAYSPWFFWDGHKDSQWAQALAPLESSVEHGFNRTRVINLIAQHYRSEYETIFGKFPETKNLPRDASPVGDPSVRATWNKMRPAEQSSINRAFSNIGKSIAAFERTLLPQTTRFDRFAQTLENNQATPAKPILTSDERQGLRLFVGQARCAECHSGPLLTNDGFHNTGIAARAQRAPDRGRAVGVIRVLKDEFNCLSVYSDAQPEDCSAVRFAVQGTPELEGAFRPPGLRNVAVTAPYMHAGQLGNLKEVLEHYNRAPEAAVGHSELLALHLTASQLGQLEAFLRTLTEPRFEAQRQTNRCKQEGCK